MSLEGVVDLGGASGKNAGHAISLQVWSREMSGTRELEFRVSSTTPGFPVSIRGGWYKLSTIRFQSRDLASALEAIAKVFQKHAAEWVEDDSHRRKLREDLHGPSQVLARLVLPPEAMELLVARCPADGRLSSVVTIYADCWDIPWEVLFLGKVNRGGGFLCERALVVRVDLEPRLSSGVQVTGDQEQPAVSSICTLIGGTGWPCDERGPGSCGKPKECEREWTSSTNRVVRNPTKSEFCDVSSKSQVCQIVCHCTASNGLRLGPGEDFGHPEIDLYGFSAPSSLICLHACESARPVDAAASSNGGVPPESAGVPLALALHRSSGASVFASMMDLPRCAGCAMAKAVAESVGKGASTWAEVQQRLIHIAPPFWLGYLFVGDYDRPFG